MQKECQSRGEGWGRRRRGREERREGKDQKLTSLLGLRASFLSTGTKRARPSPALTVLLSTPHQHAPYHSHKHDREQHTHTASLNLWRQTKKQGSDLINKCIDFQISGKYWLIIILFFSYRSCRITQQHTSDKNCLNSSVQAQLKTFNTF